MDVHPLHVASAPRAIYTLWQQLIAGFESRPDERRLCAEPIGPGKIPWYRWAFFIGAQRGVPTMPAAMRKGKPATFTFEPEALEILRILCPNTQGFGKFLSDLLR